MPTYEYRCRACGHGFDIVQSFKDESLTICPACGGELRKVYGAPAISFKGSGFYATDSRRKAGSEGQHDPRKDAKQPDGSQADSKGSKESKESKESKDKKDSKDSKAGGSSGSGGDAGGSGSSAPAKSDPSARSSKRENEGSGGS